MSTNCLKCLFK